MEWMAQGRSVEEARNLLVQLFVLFEIFHIGNSRSETLSVFRLSPFANPVLLLGTLGALGIHLFALYNPFLSDLLELSPLTLEQWLSLALAAASVLVVMEAHKAWRRWRRG